MSELLPSARVVALLAICGLLPSMADAEPATEGRRVAQVFEDFTDGVEPGCAAGVVREGRLVQAGGYGYASLESKHKLTPDSLFNIASMSKEFTAMAVLLLEQRGKLSLEDSPRKYVPELGRYADAITLRQMLHHTAGFGDGGELLAQRGVRYSDPVTLETWMHALSRLKSPQGPPGEHYEYSNTGYFLLALVVERASGVHFAKFLHDNIFAPLQMTHTFVPDAIPVNDASRARAYKPDGKGGFAIEESLWWVMGSSHVYTSVNDFAKWDSNFVTAQVGGREVIAKMQEAGVTRDGTRVDYGLGVRLTGHRQYRSIGHPGAWDAYRSDFRHFPEAKLGVIVLCNRTDANAWDRSLRLAEIYLDDGKSAGLPWDAREMAKVEGAGALNDMPPGLYRETWTGSYETLQRDGGTLQLREGRKSYPIESIAPHIYRVTFGDAYSYLAETYMAFVPKPTKGAPRFEGLFYGEPVEYVRVDAWKPASLEPYAGRYRSEELEIEYTLTPKGGALLLKQPRGESTLRPADANRFQGDVVLEFAPNESPARGFRLNAPGVRNVVFERMR